MLANTKYTKPIRYSLDSLSKRRIIAELWAFASAKNTSFSDICQIYRDGFPKLNAGSILRHSIFDYIYVLGIRENLPGPDHSFSRTIHLYRTIEVDQASKTSVNVLRLSKKK